MKSGRHSQVRLVVNADDLGLHPDIDEGILRAHREGIVTSTSVLVTGPSAGSAAAQARAQGLAMGLHFALSGGLLPAAKAGAFPSLAPGGRLRGHWPSLAWAVCLRRISREAIEGELRAQLSLARALHIELDHLDTHQHVHLLPTVRGVVEALAEREALPIRWPDWAPRWEWAIRPAPAAKELLLGALARWGARSSGLRARGVFESGRLSERRLLRALKSLPSGDWELLCHPGRGVPHIAEDPDWRYGWEEECDALCSPKVLKMAERRGIALTTYAGLRAT